MKISYRTHPFIEIIESGNLLKAEIGEEEAQKAIKLYKHIPDGYFKDMCTACKENIFYCSKGFMQAFELASDRLFELHSLEGLTKKSYCFIFDSKVNPGYKDVFCIDMKVLIDNFVIFGFAHFIENELCSIGNVCVDLQREGWKVEKSENGFYFDAEGENNFPGLAISAILLVLFEQHAEIQTKNIAAKSKIETISSKIVNDTKSLIKMLDIKHFTTINQPNAFAVRGHFRWQPCGEGLKERKLIWINEFQKEGYTAPARKLSQD